MNDLQKLAIERIIELGEEAFQLHDDYVRWRETPLTDVEKTDISLKIRRKLQKQRVWGEALLEEEE